MGRRAPKSRSATCSRSTVFSRYRTQSAPKARLAAPAHLDAARLERIATGEALTRDLINTPAEDMGPLALEHAVHDLAELHGARSPAPTATAFWTRTCR
jgi:leucyl aminopeptidase